ncbi:MAG: TolC family protein, partial [Planctomycetaceae bacterium]|nr:TolC family protein [Planctomycetaceae bacterium]
MSKRRSASSRRPQRPLTAKTREWARGLLLSAGLLTAASGCRNYNNYSQTIGDDTPWVDRVSAEVDAGAPPGPVDDPLIRPVTLRTLEEEGEPCYWEVRLEEIIAHAMANSKVLRDLGGTILTSPQAIATQYTRPLQQTDPRFGMEAALSSFDAQINSLATFQHNHRVYNNRFLGGGANLFRQDRHDYVSELSKYSATGAQFALRNITDYDDNNAPGNLFGSAWQTQWEGELRQPLLQGAGLTYNRIAGPGGLPGVPNGVLIAKVNQDMTAADFNLAVRNYLSDVVNAYWDLYFAYRDLDAKQQALERARDTWQAYEAEKVADRKGGVAEALAREQFFRFQSELEDAIAGRAGQRTQARNGATGGAFRGVNGVQAAERRLRLLIGFPVNDNRVLRPVDDPELAPIVFDWESMAGEAVYRRPELQKQRLLVKRREMELIAAQNFLQPQLDL